MNACLWAPLIWIAVSVGTDLKWRRVPNAWVLVSFFSSILLLVFLEGWSYLPSALFSASIAFVLAIPLFALRVLGGGDVKILAVAGLWLSPEGVLQVFLYSLIWGALLGLIYALLKGRLRGTIIPYTFAILLGFLSFQLSPGVLL